MISKRLKHGSLAASCSQNKPSVPSKPAYEKNLKEALDKIWAGDLQKVIVSRIEWISQKQQLDLIKLFKHLCKKYPAAHVSLVYHPDAGLWIGASPETLLAGEGNTYRTVALAGTRWGDGDIVWRQKEIEEQAFVAKDIQLSLEKVGAHIHKIDGPHTRRAGRLAHLRTEFGFSYEHDIDQLLAQLHPTPAICGTPTPNAKSFILDNEPYDRAYYTGYQGVWDPNGKTHLWVSLRNMQLCKKGYALYVGGGITKESNPEEEWEETCVKAKTLADAIYELENDIPVLVENTYVEPMISDKRPVQSLINILKAKGIKHVVLSPGSRNAPLMISLEQDRWFEKFVIVDERSAGFFAMGMAQQLRQPVMLVCTSGSASLNYAPAIAEAYYQQIPLLVVTADRPIEWIDRGEGQSIRQKDIYRNYIRASYELVQEATDPDLIWHNELLINRAIDETMQPVTGPVHINFPLRENLYGQTRQSPPQDKLVNTLAVDKHLSQQTLKKLSEQLSSSAKVLVLTGLLAPNKRLQEAISQFAQHPNVLVLTETTSNLQDERFIDAIDRTINTFTPDDETDFRPDILITLGTHIVSKMVKRMLRRQRPKSHWHIAVDAMYLDTFQSLTLNIPLEPAGFFEAIKQESITCPSDYQSRWYRRFASIKNYHARYLDMAPYSDLTAMGQIIKHLPEGTQVQMGNSSVVRYILLHGNTPGIQYFGNRGTSGIDGCTSTAVGAAYVSEQPTTLISGDLAFLYDSNALWNRYLPPNLKMILINNSGGGIFRIIDGPSKTTALDDYFEAHHQLNAKPLAEMYGVAYATAKDMDSLKEGLKWLYGQPDVALLEVFTPREENDAVLKQYFGELKARVRKGEESVTKSVSIKLIKLTPNGKGKI